PSANALAFTPRESASKTRPNGKQLGAVDVSRYLTADFTVGQLAQFRGPQTTVLYDDPGDGTRARFQSPLVTATFNAEHTALARVVASGAVRYSVRRQANEKSP